VSLYVASRTVEVVVRSRAQAEAQRTADAAALAGVGFLITAPDDADGARAAASEYARMNTVLGRPVEVRPEDIVVDVDSGTVQVRVQGSALLPKVPAWILRHNRVSFSAAAMAEGRAAIPGRPDRTVKRLRLVK